MRSESNVSSPARVHPKSRFSTPFIFFSLALLLSGVATYYSGYFPTLQETIAPNNNTDTTAAADVSGYFYFSAIPVNPDEFTTRQVYAYGINENAFFQITDEDVSIVDFTYGNNLSYGVPSYVANDSETTDPSQYSTSSFSLTKRQVTADIYEQIDLENYFVAEPSISPDESYVAYSAVRPAAFERFNNATSTTGADRVAAPERSIIVRSTDDDAITHEVDNASVPQWWGTSDLLYLNDGGLNRYNLRTGSTTRLITRPDPSPLDPNTSFAISSDGTRLVHAVPETGIMELYTVNSESATTTFRVVEYNPNSSFRTAAFIDQTSIFATIRLTLGNPPTVPDQIEIRDFDTDMLLEVIDLQQFEPHSVRLYEWNANLLSGSVMSN